MVELREYQRETVEKVFALYQDNPHGRAKFVWATGLGKTVGFSALAHKIREYSGTNVLIIAHRDELLQQAMEKYRFIDPTAVIGKVGGGTLEWGAPVTVASIQTICRPGHLKQLQLFNYGLVIVDECHHAHPDNEYGRVLEALPDAFKVGVTATDMRLDKRSNTALFGEAICTFGIRWAIKNKHLCNLRAIAIPTETTLDHIKTSKNMEGETDFAIGELASAIDTPTRNDHIAQKYLEHAKGRRAICFGVTVEHAKHICEAFLKAGVPAATITGETDHVERKRLYKALADGSLLVLCSVQVLTEGFDSPRVNCVIMARPTQSESLFIQCIGRGLRLAPGKEDCLLLDITDNVFNHKLEPVHLSRVLGLKIKDNETVTEAEEREEQEIEERRVRVRTLPTTRTKEIVVNLLDAGLTWQEKPNGMFVLEVGREKHRIALVPNGYGTYDVWARLFPGYEAQQWANAIPLDWAQQFAEREARKILTSPEAARWADRNHTKRRDPMTEKQKKFLDWKKIPYTDQTTKGEASELIDKWYQQDEAKKAAKLAKQKAKISA